MLVKLQELPRSGRFKPKCLIVSKDGENADGRKTYRLQVDQVVERFGSVERPQDIQKVEGKILSYSYKASHVIPH